MSLPLCLEISDDMKKEIICAFNEGYGSSRTSIKLALKFKVRVPYSKVIAVLKENNLYRTMSQAKKVMPVCKPKGTKHEIR